MRVVCMSCEIIFIKYSYCEGGRTPQSLVIHTSAEKTEKERGRTADRGQSAETGGRLEMKEEVWAGHNQHSAPNTTY